MREYCQPLKALSRGLYGPLLLKHRNLGFLDERDWDLSLFHDFSRDIDTYVASITVESTKDYYHFLTERYEPLSVAKGLTPAQHQLCQKALVIYALFKQSLQARELAVTDEAICRAITARVIFPEGEPIESAYRKKAQAKMSCALDLPRAP